MTLRTSNFRISGKNPNAVAISAGVPGWFRGRRCWTLTPPWRIVRGPREDAERWWLERLAALDPHQVARELGDHAILLCWEDPGKFCHRHLVANWLRKSGFEVSEIVE